jgi:hypothetical protein
MKWTKRLEGILRSAAAEIWASGILIIIVGLLLAIGYKSVIIFVIGLIVGAMVIEMGLNSLALKGTIMEMSYNLDKLTYIQQGVNRTGTPNAYGNVAGTYNAYANTTASPNGYANAAATSNTYANATTPSNNNANF